MWEWSTRRQLRSPNNVPMRENALKIKWGPLTNSPHARAEREGTQLNVLKVGPIPAFYPSGLSCSSASVNLGIVAWKCLLDVGYFLAVEEYPLVLWASSDSAWCLCCSWLAGALSETWKKLESKPFSVKWVIPGDESTVVFALKIVAQTPISFCSQDSVQLCLVLFCMEMSVCQCAASVLSRCGSPGG